MYRKIYSHANSIRGMMMMMMILYYTILYYTILYILYYTINTPYLGGWGVFFCNII